MSPTYTMWSLDSDMTSLNSVSNARPEHERLGPIIEGPEAGAMAGRFHRGGAQGTTAPCAVGRAFQSRTVTGDKLALFGLQIRDFPQTITLAAASQRHWRTFVSNRSQDVQGCFLAASPMGGMASEANPVGVAAKPSFRLFGGDEECDHGARKVDGQFSVPWRGPSAHGGRGCASRPPAARGCRDQWHHV